MHKWIGGIPILMPPFIRILAKNKSNFFLVGIGGNAEFSLGMRTGSVIIQAIYLLFWAHQIFLWPFTILPSALGCMLQILILCICSHSGFTRVTKSLTHTGRLCFFLAHYWYPMPSVIMDRKTSFSVCLVLKFSFSEYFPGFSQTFCVFTLCFDNGKGLKAHFSE